MRDETQSRRGVVGAAACPARTNFIRRNGEAMPPLCRGRWPRRGRRGCTVGSRRRVPTLLRFAFPWGKAAARKGSRMRGGIQYRFLCVVAGHAPPAQILYAETAKRCLPACRGRWPRRGRRGCTVGSCRGLSNDGFYRIDGVHPLSHGLWPMTAPPAQGSL